MELPGVAVRRVRGAIFFAYDIFPGTFVFGCLQQCQQAIIDREISISGFGFGCFFDDRAASDYTIAMDVQDAFFKVNIVPSKSD